MSYKKLGKKMSLRPGQEFAEAINAANEMGVPCVLADRDSEKTITRLTSLVLRSGDLFGVYNRLKKLSDEEIEPLQEQAQLRRERMMNASREGGGGAAGGSAAAPAKKKSKKDLENEQMTDMIEEMKRPEVLQRIIGRWCEEVPEMAQVTFFFCLFLNVAPPFLPYVRN